MISLHPFLSVAMGLVIGSFLNVVIARLPHGKSLARPGSQCPQCQHKIRWFENIPIISFLCLRARCRGCKKPISIRYPIVEGLTALLFVTCEIRFGVGPLLYLRDWPLMAILVAITFIDIDHRIIPDSLSLGGLVLGLATSWADPTIGLEDSLLGAAVGFAIFYALAWAYFKKTGRDGLGGGDIKMMAMIGSLVGLQGVFGVILVASVLGSIVGITSAFFSKQKSLFKTAIPFGPFLVIGLLYQYFIGFNLMDF